MKKASLVIASILFIMTVNSSLPAAYAAGNLSKGDTRENIIIVQERLGELGYLRGRPDGVFGSRTRRAVQKFQYDSGLSSDGVVGPRTEAALGVSLMEYGEAGASADGNNTMLLAKLIYAESRAGFSYRDRVGIGAVVLNRMRAAGYPKTVAGVVYQSGAFESVANGRIKRGPNAAARAAARDALNGFDPTGGALGYNAESGKAVFW